MTSLRKLATIFSLVLVFSVSFSAVAQQCSPGEFSGDGNAPCQQCPAGRITSLSGQTSCILCDPGRFASTTGLTACSVCVAGTFADSFGSTACEDCPAGRFSSSDESTNCSTCLSGTASSAGATACTDCDRGTFSSSSGATVCEDCPVGKFQSSEGGSACSDCSPGTFASTTGSTVCTNCSAGSIAEGSGETECTFCPTDTFQDEAGGSTCESCAEDNNFIFTSGTTECVECSNFVRRRTTLLLRGISSATENPVGRVSVTAVGRIDDDAATTLDPLVDGLHLAIEDTSNIRTLDADISGGEFDSDLGVGWIKRVRRDLSGLITWRYRDNTDSPVAGITRITLVLFRDNLRDRRNFRLTVRGRSASYVLDSEATPFRLAIGFGDDRSSPCVLYSSSRSCRFRRSNDLVRCGRQS